jgi:hypothetical protein
MEIYLSTKSVGIRRINTYCNLKRNFRIFLRNGDKCYYFKCRSNGIPWSYILYTNKYYIQLFKHCATIAKPTCTHGTQAVVVESFRRYAIYSSQFHKLINLTIETGSADLQPVQPWAKTPRDKNAQSEGVHLQAEDRLTAPRVFPQ